MDRPKVLLIEDSVTDSRLIQLLLEANKDALFDVEPVSHLSAGQQRLAAGGIAAVLLDLILPDSSGLETLLKLRPCAAGVPIIILTGLSDESMAVEAVRLGAQDYLNKDGLTGRLLARSLYYAIERARGEEAIRRQAAMLEALHDTAVDLASQRALPDLLQAIVARAMDLLRASRGGIYLYRPATDDLYLDCVRNLDEKLVGGVLQRGEGLSGRVLESGRPLAVADYGSWEGRARLYKGLDLGACVAVPIFWGGHLLGVLSIVDTPPRTFTAEDIALLERFTPLAAAALENARLYNDLQQQMQELQNTQLQLIRSAKLAAVGELAAGVAHELNNPLTSILGFAELLANADILDAGVRRDLETIASESHRARSIVRNLLEFARPSRPGLQRADINAILQQAVALIRSHLEKGGVAVSEEYAPELGPVVMDVDQIKQVLLNLITNAIQSMQAGGKLIVRTERVGQEVAIAIVDTGVGIPAEIKDRIFEPFFTTKRAGTGLGLSISQRVVQEHGGRITVSSTPGQGSTFTIWLPLEPPPEGETRGR